MQVQNISDTYHRGRKILFITENYFVSWSDIHNQITWENMRNGTLFSLSLKITYKKSRILVVLKE